MDPRRLHARRLLSLRRQLPPGPLHAPRPAQSPRPRNARPHPPQVPLPLLHLGHVLRPLPHAPPPQKRRRPSHRCRTRRPRRAPGRLRGLGLLGGPHGPGPRPLGRAQRRLRHARPTRRGRPPTPPGPLPKSHDAAGRPRRRRDTKKRRCRQAAAPGGLVRPDAPAFRRRRRRGRRRRRAGSTRAAAASPQADNNPRDDDDHQEERPHDRHGPAQGQARRPQACEAVVPSRARGERQQRKRHFFFGTQADSEDPPRNRLLVRALRASRPTEKTSSRVK
mmetsp:Transcript_9461/g.28887  ORF Transcript_9461/g.28887 Transcript_9461/m.28887 type:complete len:278 (-) Transcript_9461:148-981(-)